MNIQTFMLLLDLLLHGLFVEDKAKNIPVVHIKKLITTDNNFTIQWDPVESKDLNDPIIGFKMKVWEAPCINNTVYVTENGFDWIEEVRTFRKKLSPLAIPDEKPINVYFVPADKLEYTVAEVLLGVWYQVRVLAFTRRADGPLSDPYQFLLNADKENGTCYVD